MRKAEWPNSDKPKEMLYALLKAKKCGRKFRLFTCACCRRVWPLLIDPRSRQAVEQAEAVADDVRADSRMAEIFDGANAAYSERVLSSPDSGVTKAHLEAAQAAPLAILSFETPENALRHASIASYHVTIAANAIEDKQAHPSHETKDSAQFAAAARESHSQANLLRCIFGNPFRPVSFHPAWVSSTAKHLAETIYVDRAFDRLPILADALEDAGCDDRDILDHCRQPGEHVRGCWVVDLVLGKS